MVSTVLMTLFAQRGPTGFRCLVVAKEGNAGKANTAYSHAVVALTHSLTQEQTTTAVIAPARLVPDPEVPFYKKANGLWGSSRVYRRIRKAPGESAMAKPTPDDSSVHSASSQEHIVIFGKRWGSH